MRMPASALGFMLRGPSPSSQVREAGTTAKLETVLDQNGLCNRW